MVAKYMNLAGLGSDWIEKANFGVAWRHGSMGGMEVNKLLNHE